MQNSNAKQEELKEPHLIDLGNFAEIAQWFIVWLALTAGTKVVQEATKDMYDSAKDLLKTLKRRFGASKLADLKKEINSRLDAEIRKQPGLTPEQLKEKTERIQSRMTELFREFE